MPSTGKPGRPKAPEKVIHQDLDYALVHRTRNDGQIIQVARRIAFGDQERVEKWLEDSPSHIVNTSYVERSDSTFRQMDAHLLHKSLTFAKALRWLKAKFALIVAMETLVRPHMTLSSKPDRSTTPRSPPHGCPHPGSFLEYH